jgi:hypothetical protein
MHTNICVKVTKERTKSQINDSQKLNNIWVNATYILRMSKDSYMFQLLEIVIIRSYIMLPFHFLLWMAWWQLPLTAKKCNSFDTKYTVYRVSHELRSLLRESVPYVKIYRYNPKHQCQLNGYRDNGQRILKLWQLSYSYWLPNTY